MIKLASENAINNQVSGFVSASVGDFGETPAPPPTHTHTRLLLFLLIKRAHVCARVRLQSPYTVWVHVYGE